MTYYPIRMVFCTVLILVFFWSNFGRPLFYIQITYQEILIGGTNQKLAMPSRDEIYASMPNGKQFLFREPVSRGLYQSIKRIKRFLFN